MAQPNTFWAVAAPTIGDVERTCFTGESGILSLAEPGDIAPGGYNINKTRISLSNGSVIQGFSADSMERARGSNLFGCWCDELDLLGLAAPRKSMSLQATMELDSENETLQAQVAEAYQAALEERDRELAGLRAQLAAAQAAGPAALTVLQGKAEQPTGHT